MNGRRLDKKVHQTVLYLRLVTIKLTAHQLHAKCAGFAAHHRDDPDVLGNDWRVKHVGLCAVVICVTQKNLYQPKGNRVG